MHVKRFLRSRPPTPSVNGAFTTPMLMFVTKRATEAMTSKITIDRISRWTGEQERRKGGQPVEILPGKQPRGHTEQHLARHRQAVHTPQPRPEAQQVQQIAPG